MPAPPPHAQHIALAEKSASSSESHREKAWGGSGHALPDAPTAPRVESMHPSAFSSVASTKQIGSARRRIEGRRMARCDRSRTAAARSCPASLSMIEAREGWSLGFVGVQNAQLCFPAHLFFLIRLVVNLLKLELKVRVRSHVISVQLPTVS